MGSTWNGKHLQETFTQEAGYSDSGSLERTLRYLNEVQRDIASSANWPNLLFKLKKFISEGSQYVDLSPQIPDAPTIQVKFGEGLSPGSECKVKVTFVLFDKESQEYSSIESEPSLASNAVTPSDENLQIQVTNIPSYDGNSDIEPLVIHRRIYLKQGNNPYYLVKTLDENDSNTVVISADPSSVIEPPEQSMVENISAEDLAIHAGTAILVEESIDLIQKYDPGLTAVGIPRYYARISDTKIMLYPRPSYDVTLSYWVKRRPSRIFADEDRAIQLSRSLENVLDAGVNWKWLKYKLDADWRDMYNLYLDLLTKSKAEKVKKSGKFSKVKVVC